MASYPTNAKVSPIKKTNITRSPLKDTVRSGNYTTTPKRG